MKTIFGRLPAICVAVLVAWPAAGQSVLDGDSLQIGNTRYRLNGIDAPEIDQICRDGWRAGYEAGRYLEELIDGKQVTCIAIDGRRNGEINALCRADGIDLAGAMVTAGRAFAFVPHSAQYIAQEAAAARANRGVHAHGCRPPWKWRAQRSPSP